MAANPPQRRKKRGNLWTRRKKKKDRPQPSAADAALSAIYYNYGSEGALNNTPEYLYRLGRQRLPTLTRKQVKAFLTKQPSYTVHRRLHPLQYPHRPIRVAAPRIRADADLVDMQNLAQWNDGYNFILVAIDAFTRYTWMAPMRDKGSVTTANAFNRLMDREGLACIHLYTDQGTEFLGQPFQRMLKRRGISHRICGGEQFHCPFVERVNRTLKEKLYQAMTAQVSRRWVDLLPRMLTTYNSTIHSSTGKRPANVTDANSLDVYAKMHVKKGEKKKKKKKKKYLFTKGDYVRIVKLRGAFDHGYLPRFTWEVFRIADRVPASPSSQDPPAYFLEDMKGERITSGIFYESELSRVDKSLVDAHAAWPVREVLDRRKGGRELLVWWQGFPREQAEWIPARQILRPEQIL